MNYSEAARIMETQITYHSTVCSTACSGCHIKPDNFRITGPFRGNPPGMMDSPRKGQVKRKASPCHDVQISFRHFNFTLRWRHSGRDGVSNHQPHDCLLNSLLRKHQSPTSLAYVSGIHRWPVNFPHKGPVTLKMFPFDDVIMWYILDPCRQKNVLAHNITPTSTQSSRFIFCVFTMSICISSLYLPQSNICWNMIFSNERHRVYSMWSKAADRQSSQLWLNKFHLSGVLIMKQLRP